MTIQYLLLYLYNIILFVVTSYLVYFKDASGWLYLLMLCLAFYPENKDDK